MSPICYCSSSELRNSDVAIWFVMLLVFIVRFASLCWWKKRIRKWITKKNGLCDFLGLNVHEIYVMFILFVGFLSILIWKVDEREDDWCLCDWLDRFLTRFLSPLNNVTNDTIYRWKTRVWDWYRTKTKITCARGNKRGILKYLFGLIDISINE